ncbi:HK97 gp10 family phage protein [Aureimonas altamirensis]|uniref:HK97-gp10 family putative phage morphogenesis protein n=1 Tax=Aureimonas altamirensis TaxID=370622 RepID=UPI002036F583|nr:HK97-gp10 family putative phage morphogenesis protein [Aureimonas altamirensis]MCM2504097.1 HK97 gp10 family phage protein [Aureimonas altamirensis]
MARSRQVDKLFRRLNRIPERVREAAQPAVNKGAQDMAGTMRHLAPVDEGDLRDSVTVTPAGQTTPPYSQPGGSILVPDGAAVVTAGNSDVRYPHLLEYGTSDTQAQPFFWPAVRLNRKRAENRIKRAMAKSVRETWGGK